MSQYQNPYVPFNNYVPFNATSQSAYTPDFQSVPFPQPGAGPAPGGNTPIPRPKKFTRNTNSSDGHHDRPLRSAMKRSSTREDVGRSRRGSHQSRRESQEKRPPRDPLREQIVNGMPIPVHNVSRRSLSRQRTNSKVAFMPDHIFVSFKRENELSVTNIIDEVGIGKLSEAVVGMWPEGHDEITSRRHRWRTVFHGSPWTSSSRSENGIAARRIIRNVFTALAMLGFTYSTVTNGSVFSPPSLIFSRVPAELFHAQSADFFILSISRSQRFWTFIEAPDSIVRNLGVDLRQYFPYQVSSDRLTEPGMLELEIRDRTGTTPKLDRYLFVAWLLQYISMKGGYVLEAAVPLGRKSFLGFGGQKEVWVFRRRGQFGI